MFKVISKTRDKAKNMNEDRDKGSFILLYYFRLFFFENKNTGVYLQVICAESKEEKSKAATHAME